MKKEIGYLNYQNIFSIFFRFAIQREKKFISAASRGNPINHWWKAKHKTKTPINQKSIKSSFASSQYKREPFLIWIKRSIR